MEYYSALKRKEILTHAKIRMNLEDIMLNEISQSQKKCDFINMWYLDSQIHRDRK